MKQETVTINEAFISYEDYYDFQTKVLEAGFIQLLFTFTVWVDQDHNQNDCFYIAWTNEDKDAEEFSRFGIEHPEVFRKFIGDLYMNESWSCSQATFDDPEAFGLIDAEKTLYNKYHLEAEPEEAEPEEE